MAEYTQQIEQQIAQLLRTRGVVTPSMIPGVDEAGGVALFREYVQRHHYEQLFLDGAVLSATPPTASDAGLGASMASEAGQPNLVAGPYAAAPPPSGYGAPPPSGYGAPPPSGYGGVDPLPPSGYSPPLTGRTPLDAMPVLEHSKPVSNALFLLPIFFSIIGGVAAWAIAKDRDASKAQALLITGFVVAALSACVTFGLPGAIGGAIGANAMATDTAWPATGTTTFYYFGTNT